MIRSLLPASLALLLGAHSVHAAPPSQRMRPPLTPKAMSCSPGEVLLIVNANRVTRGASSLRLVEPSGQAALQRLGLDRLEAVGPPAGANGVRVLKALSTKPGFDPVAAARELQATGAFRAACPNYKLSLFNTIPNDQDLYLQWYVDDGGDADIRLPAAWDLELGDSNVVIAIMDTGTDTGHPDLDGHIWHNPGETPGNGIDDDGNGLIDDTMGWDFARNTNDPNPEYIPEYVPDLGLDLDIGFHGTFVSGIASALTNNTEGIAGATWRCKLMPLKVAHPDSGITSEAIAGAFVYAAEQHASVLNMSLGGPGGQGVPEFFQALVDMADSAGVVCVAAAGNDGSSTPSYPAFSNGVLAVGATDDIGNRAFFSNWGSWVDVAAPGSAMWSSIARNYTLTDIDQILYFYLFGWDLERPYMSGDGTSFACPLTAGVCALVRSHFPWMTPAQVRARLVSTGDVVSFDHPMGTKVNAYRAIHDVVTAVDPVAFRGRIALENATPNPSGGPTTLRFTLAAAGPAKLEVFDCAGRRVRLLADGGHGAGPHAVTWDGRDDQGHRLGAGLYFVRLASAGQVLSRKLALLEN